MSNSGRSTHKRRIKSCESCHMRKVKCDRQKPCAECSRKKTPCRYFETPMDGSQTIPHFEDRLGVIGNIIDSLKGVSYASKTRDFFAQLREFEMIYADPKRGASIVNIHYDPRKSIPIGVLKTFSAAMELLNPSIAFVFSPITAKAYWKLLTQPVFCELGGRSVKISWSSERRDILKRIVESPHRKLTSFRPKSPSISSTSDSAYIDGDDTTLSTLTSTSPSNGFQSPFSFAAAFDTGNSLDEYLDDRSGLDLFIPTDPEGFYVSKNGEKYDALAKVLHLHTTNASDLVNLLEYAIAFLRGCSYMEWEDVVRHLSFNIQRILYSLMTELKRQITVPLAERLLYCLTILANQGERTGDFPHVAFYLQVALDIGIEYNLMETQAKILSRVCLSKLFWCKSDGERNHLGVIYHTYFAHTPAAEFRWKFSYSSSLMRIPYPNNGSEKELQDTQHIWQLAFDYMKDCEVILPVIPQMAKNPGTSSFYYCISLILKSEMAARLGDFQVAIENAQHVTFVLSKLDDVSSLVVIGHLVDHCKVLSSASVNITVNNRVCSVSDFFTDVLLSIPTMPIPSKHDPSTSWDDEITTIYEDMYPKSTPTSVASTSNSSDYQSNFDSLSTGMIGGNNSNITNPANFNIRDYNQSSSSGGNSSEPEFEPTDVEAHFIHSIPQQHSAPQPLAGGMTTYQSLPDIGNAIHQGNVSLSDLL